MYVCSPALGSERAMDSEEQGQKVPAARASGHHRPAAQDAPEHRPASQRDRPPAARRPVRSPAAPGRLGTRQEGSTASTAGSQTAATAAAAAGR